MGGVVAGADQQGGKQFFSEEKNQKTFIASLADISGPWPPNGKLRRNKSLLLLFFRKEALSLLPQSGNMRA